METIPEEQVDQLEIQEPRPWFNRRQWRKTTAAKRAMEVEREEGIARIEVVDKDVAEGKRLDVSNVTRGKDLNPPSRRVSFSVENPV